MCVWLWVVLPTIQEKRWQFGGANPQPTVNDCLPAVVIVQPHYIYYQMLSHLLAMDGSIFSMDGSKMQLLSSSTSGEAAGWLA